MPYKLRNYQLDAVSHVAARRTQGAKATLIEAPTGAGKTVIFSYIAHQEIQSDGKIITLVHTTELAEQAAAALKAAGIPANLIGIEQAERQAPHGIRAVVAMIQTLSSPSRRASLLDRMGGPPSLLICDEAHHTGARTWRSTIDALTAGDAFLLGVSATPYRMDGKPLSEVFGDSAQWYAVPEKPLLEANVIVPKDEKYLSVLTKEDLKGIHTRAGDYAVDQIASLVRQKAVPAIIDETAALVHDGRKTIVFLADVLTAHQVADALVARGIPAAAISGGTPAKERTKLIERFKTSKIMALANCQILTEGFDVKDVGAIVLGRPTKSLPLQKQMVGRGLRAFPGKNNCKVVFLIEPPSPPAKKSHNVAERCFGASGSKHDWRKSIAASQAARMKLMSLLADPSKVWEVCEILRSKNPGSFWFPLWYPAEGDKVKTAIWIGNIQDLNRKYIVFALQISGSVGDIDSLNNPMFAEIIAQDGEIEILRSKKITGGLIREAGEFLSQYGNWRDLDVNWSRDWNKKRHIREYTHTLIHEWYRGHQHEKNIFGWSAHKTGQMITGERFLYSLIDMPVGPQSLADVISWVERMIGVVANTGKKANKHFYPQKYRIFRVRLNEKLRVDSDGRLSFLMSEAIKRLGAKTQVDGGFIIVETKGVQSISYIKRCLSYISNEFTIVGVEEDAAHTNKMGDPK